VNWKVKTAKKILCRNERQKMGLRKMGFIEDRIMIKEVFFSPTFTVAG
jgi:hypothetical protein